MTQLTRKAGAYMFSIEGTFAAMRTEFGPEWDLTVAACPRPSQGVWDRIANILAARKSGGDIQHILGDVHYLTLGTKPSTTILTICDCGFAYHPSRVKRFLLRLFWLHLPIRSVARVCAISNKTKNEILSLTRIRPEKIVVIPVCIANEYQHQPHVFRSRRPVILQIGTTENKNVPRLIEALRDLDCDLHIIGPRTAAIGEALAAHPVSCRFSQQLSLAEIVAAYRDADIVSFVSTYEGFGMPIVEAQAVGRAVLTADLDPMRDVAGGAAALADPLSVRSIRENLERLIRDDGWREELVRAGLVNATKYRASSVAAAYRGVYESVLAESGKGR